MPEGSILTNHHAQTPRYAGYTGMDWFKLYGFFAVALSALAFTYTQHFELFDDIFSQSPQRKAFTIFLAGGGLLILVPAVIGFFWWASGALVKYSRWMVGNSGFWRWFWMVILTFFFYVELDPLDSIHPGMSSQGLAPAPNLLLLFEGKWEFFPFQWGYFLLWFLFWFLIAALHWQYFVDGMRDVWFFSNRVHRYTGSVLTGFRETIRTQNTPALTVRLGTDEHPQIQPHRQVPFQMAERVTAEQAAAITAADHSNAIVSVPGQPTVLFVDLGTFHFTPGLELLTDDNGEPLLGFGKQQADASTSREALVVPLKRNPVRMDFGGDK